MKTDLLKIAVAKEKHIPDLKTIWKKCFGDSEQYINFFFEKKYPLCHTITAVYDDKPVAATYLMPITATEYGSVKKGFYLYALGVLPQYQKKGIGETIVKKICDYCTKNDCFCMLSPATDNLVGYYKKFGFVENAYVTALEYKAENLYTDMSFFSLNADKFETLRNSFFKNLIQWDKTSLNYVLEENSFVNGYNIYFTDDNTEYFAVMRPDNGILNVVESNIPVLYQQRYTDCFCTVFNCITVIWHIPQSLEDKNPLLRGMSFNLSKDNYYFNHILN